MSDEKYKNKYRIPSARAMWHDYNGGAYFITVRTKNGEYYFGDVVRADCRDVAGNVSTTNVSEPTTPTRNKPKND